VLVKYRNLNADEIAIQGRQDLLLIAWRHFNARNDTERRTDTQGSILQDVRIASTSSTVANVQPVDTNSPGSINTQTQTHLYTVPVCLKHTYKRVLLIHNLYSTDHILYAMR